MTSSSSRGAIWPWATPTDASGSRRWILAATVWMVSTRLWTRKTWPPRSISRWIASPRIWSDQGSTWVMMGIRSRGGVWIRERSRTPGEGEVESPRDGRGGQGENIHGGPEPLEAFLVPHAEPLLLVHDQEPQVLEDDIAREEAVGPDDDVRLPPGPATGGSLLLLRRPEPAQGADPDRVVRQPLLEGPAVLLHQDRGRGQDRHLLCRPERP